MRKQRLYAPFVKQGKRWIRATIRVTNNEGVEIDVPHSAFSKEFAIRRYQDWLLAPYLYGVNEIRELRPVKGK